MATIDSLDLATLTNNPQSIAEALEDALETTTGTIGSLKTSAQTDHNAIEGLLTSAQSDHDAIEALLNSTSTSNRHQYTTLSNSWLAGGWSADTSSEDGIMMQKFGRLYIANVLIEKDVGIQTGYETILNLGTHIDHPNGTVILGVSFFDNGSNRDYSANLQLKSDGDLVLYYNNTQGDFMVVGGNFIGLDVS